MDAATPASDNHSHLNNLVDRHREMIEVRANGRPWLRGEWLSEYDFGGMFQGVVLATGKEEVTGLAKDVPGRTFHVVED